MSRGVLNPVLLSVLACAGLGVGFRAAGQSVPNPAAAGNTLGEDEVRALTSRVIANQERNDEADAEYERVEERLTRALDEQKNFHTLDDKTFRVVPTGSGTLKLLLKDEGHPVDPDTYRTELLTWQKVLAVALDPNDPRVKASVAKSEKREKDRNELLEGVKLAYVPRWIGNEVYDGRTCDVIELDPDPQFTPHSLAQEVLTHARVKAWVDQESGQVAHLEADIIRDISFGAFLGKVYRGGHFELDQIEVAPGVWLPQRYQYDYAGRKLVFGFETHDLTEISRYRRVGPPKEALEVVSGELKDTESPPGDP